MPEFAGLVVTGTSNTVATLSGGANFKATIAQLYAEVSALETQCDNLTACGHAIVDSAHGNKDTVIVPTETVDDMAQCLEEIRAGRAAGQ